MKKIAILLTIALLLCCTGCSRGTVTQEEYDELKQSYEELQRKYEELEQGAAAEPETEPEESTEPETEQTESEVPVTTDEEVDISESTTIRGGTNQNDAVLLPMNTKLYGTASGGQGLWYAFTTGEDANATYKITTVNKTIGTYNLNLYVYDEYGERLGSKSAGSNGLASTLSLDLKSNTIYYLYIKADQIGDTIDYMLLMRNPEEQNTGYGTSDSLAEAKGVSGVLEGEIIPGTNQDDACMIPTGAKISGTVSDGIGAWFSFTTNSVENATYKITTVNMTTGTYNLNLYVFNEYGERLGSKSAGSNGLASTLSLDLKSNTIYYLYIKADQIGDTIDYTVSIQAPEEPAAQTATIEKIEEQLVFETPFELNSTQVMFVANKAVFIDENAAKAALEPVADVILAHPDHPILLAGTTATDGTQESCVNLSNKRAEAVKNLLVSAFGVPESQIQTIGLGYEADPFVRGKDRDANGRFVESEGAKNRRVVVLDIEDPIAKELLGQ